MMISRWIRENRDTIRIASYVLLVIAGLVVIVEVHVMLGVLILGVGMFLIARAVGKLLGPSDYAGDGTINGMNGMGRQQSSINKKPSSTVANEVTSDIWNQMTTSEENKPENSR